MSPAIWCSPACPARRAPCGSRPRSSSTPSTRRSSASSRLRCARAHFARARSGPWRRVACFWACDAQLVDLHLDVERRLARRARRAPRTAGCETCWSDSLHDLADVAGCSPSAPAVFWLFRQPLTISTITISSTTPTPAATRRRTISVCWSRRVRRRPRACGRRGAAAARSRRGAALGPPVEAPSPRHRRRTTKAIRSFAGTVLEGHQYDCPPRSPVNPATSRSARAIPAPRVQGAAPADGERAIRWTRRRPSSRSIARAAPRRRERRRRAARAATIARPGSAASLRWSVADGIVTTARCCSAATACSSASARAASAWSGARTTSCCTARSRVKRICARRPGRQTARRARRARRSPRARLAHPAIVALYEACADERRLLPDLRARRRRDARAADRAATRSPTRQVLEIGVALADALAHAHARGVIHRDVKPQNVLVPARSAAPTRRAAKLTDFGGASLAGEDALTRTGDVLGTLAYMAPEQSEGREVGEPADLYSLALVLYEALSGRQSGARRHARRDRAAHRPRTRPARAHGAATCRARSRDALDTALARRARATAARSTELRDWRCEEALDERPAGAAPIARCPPRARSASARPRDERASTTGMHGAPRRSAAPPAPHELRGAAELAQHPPARQVAGARAEARPRRLRCRARSGSACVVAACAWQARDRRARAWRCAARRRAAPLLLLALPRPAAARLAAGRARAGARPRRPRRRLPGDRRPGRALARRAALGALGYWWLALAEPLLGARRLWLGAARRHARRARSGRARSARRRRPRHRPDCSALGRAARRGAVGRRRGRAAAGSCAAQRRAATSSRRPSGRPRCWPPRPCCDAGLSAGTPSTPRRAGRVLGAVLGGVDRGRRPRLRGPVLRPVRLRSSAAQARCRPTAATRGTAAMNLLKSVETTIANLVEGTFGRVFRSEVRPMELARKLAREMDEHRTVVGLARVRARTSTSVWLSPEDRARYEGVEDEVIDELCAYLLEHARREDLILASPARDHLPHRRAAGARRIRHPGAARPARTVTVTTTPARPRRTCAGEPSRRTRPDDDLQHLRARARAASRRPGRGAARRARCSSVAGSACSCRPTGGDDRAQPRLRHRARRHRVSRAATPRSGPARDGWTIADLGSTNGVRVNGREIRGAQPLQPGDRIELGSTEIVFELG